MRTIMIQFIKRIRLYSLLACIRKFRRKNLILNVNNANFSKRALLIYITAPFQSRNTSETHQNHWQVKELARLIGERKYVVDVAQYGVQDITLKHTYDMVIGLIPRGVNIYKNNINVNCIKIAYLTSMNLSVTSANEETRLQELCERRGVMLKPRRNAGVIEKEIEQFDAAWSIGNEYNYRSYECFNMPPVSYIQNTGYVFDWATDVEGRNPKCFLFVSSVGQVHKGLDLLLEVFSTKAKDCELYIFSGFDKEEDFVQAYHEELYNTPNIKPLGFVDIRSDEFKNIASKCAYMVMPSCAEAKAGSVLTAMSAGLIPIVSLECGYSDEEAINMPDCTIETISQYINVYSKKDSKWIAERSAKSIQIVKSKYSKECYTESINKALDNVLKS